MKDEFAARRSLDMKKFMAVLSFSLLLTLCSAGLAKADGVDNFTYTSNGNTFIWQLQSSPSLSDNNIYPGIAFTIGNVLVTENGGTPQLGSFDFYSTECSGGFDLTFGQTVPVNTIGQQLYSGWEGTPTFLTGTFLETDYGLSDSGIPGTLVISTANVPEPSTVGLLAAGILLLLVAFGSRKIVGPVGHI
jgi:hypothetical protein